MASRLRRSYCDAVESAVERRRAHLVALRARAGSEAQSEEGEAMSEQDMRLSAEDEAAVERYRLAVESGRKKGRREVLDWLLQPKITYMGERIPIAIRRMIANAMPREWFR